MKQEVTFREALNRLESKEAESKFPNNLVFVAFVFEDDRLYHGSYVHVGHENVVSTDIPYSSLINVVFNLTKA
jgi:hypothetical protein